MKRIVLALSLAALTTCLLAVAPTAAAPPRNPDAVIKTKTIDASVSIDPTLKAYPGLYPRLLAAGKRAMREWRAAANKDYRESRQFFREGHSYEFDRTYEKRSAIQGYVSIVRSDFNYSAGAAHPNHPVDTLLWDVKARKFINVRRFFNETATSGPTMRTLAKVIRAAVIAAKNTRGIPPKMADDPMWLDSIKPDLTKIGGVAIAPSTESGKSAGLIIYFPPYAVGSYAEGDYIVFVPWTMYKTHLSAAGERLFGGTRPPGDTKRHGD
jgi:hypothetical protein